MYNFRNMIISLVLIITILVTPSLIDNSSEKDIQPNLRRETIFKPLKEDLLSEGFSENFLDMIYSDPRVKYHSNIIYNKKNIAYNKNFDDKYIYNSNFSKYNLSEFFDRYSKYFQKAHQKYGVNKEAISAVLFVETKFGKVLGQHSVLNVLSSLALSNKEFARKDIKNHVEKRYHYLSHKKREYIKDYYINYVERKSLNAKRELVYLLNLHKQNKLDIFSLPGSYAGAFGYPQFMPSNYHKYGVDGDNDGYVNLFSFPDAILSVGNFLQYHGWEANIKAKKEALLRYNYSNSYVAEVLNTADYIDNNYN